tara:strand:- start:70 stop:366 length:297 start_codon:yes stop_codon:yes gene_type:complete
MRLEYKRERLFDGSKTLLSFRKEKICSGTGYSAVCTIRDKKICDKTGYSAVCNVNRDYVCEKTGFKKLIKIKDIRKEIKNSDILSDAHIAAIWWYIIK